MADRRWMDLCDIGPGRRDEDVATIPHVKRHGDPSVRASQRRNVRVSCRRGFVGGCNIAVRRGSGRGTGDAALHVPRPASGRVRRTRTSWLCRRFRCGESDHRTLLSSVDWLVRRNRERRTSNARESAPSETSSGSQSGPSLPFRSSNEILRLPFQGTVRASHWSTRPPFLAWDWSKVLDPRRPLASACPRQEHQPPRRTGRKARFKRTTWRNGRACSLSHAHLRSPRRVHDREEASACMPGTRGKAKSARGRGSSACRRPNRRKRCANALDR